MTWEVHRCMKPLPRSAAVYTEALALQCPLQPETSCRDPAQHPAVPSVPEYEITITARSKLRLLKDEQHKSKSKTHTL